MYRLNIYDALGLPRTDIPDTEIAKLDADVQQPAYFAVMSAFAESNESEAAYIAAQKATRAAHSDIRKRMDAHEKLMPKWTPLDEWKRTVARLPMPEPDPEVEKKLKASIKAIDKANEHLAQCQRAEHAAARTRAEKRAVFGRALIEWSKVDGSPRDVGTLIKERAAAETKRRLAEIEASGQPATLPTNANDWPIAVAAKNRPRTSPLIANTSLRSPARRHA